LTVKGSRDPAKQERERIDETAGGKGPTWIERKSVGRKKERNTAQEEKRRRNDVPGRKNDHG